MQSCNDSVRVGGALVGATIAGVFVCAQAADTRPANNILAPIFFIGKPDAAPFHKVTKRLLARGAF